jgi:hypothetical protein
MADAFQAKYRLATWVLSFTIIILLGAACTVHTRPHLNFRYIDKTGQEIIAGPFTWAEDFSEGLACVKDSVRGYGYIDHTGKFVIEPQFGRAHDFSEGLARACKPNDHNYGFIDKRGNWVIPPQFIDATDFSEGLAWVGIATASQDGSQRQWGRRSGYINMQGQFAFAINGANSAKTSRLLCYAEIESCKFKDGLAPFLKTPENKWGYIDKTGKFAIEPEFEQAGCFASGLARVKTAEGFRFVNRKGQFVGKAFAEARDFSDGMAAVSFNNEPAGKWGYLDTSGQMVIEPQFDVVANFSEGHALVMTLVPAKINSVIQSQNLQLQRSLGMGSANSYEQRAWVIDRTGKKVDIDLGPEWPVDFKSEHFANHFSEGLLGVRCGNDAGYVDKAGRMVIPARWRVIGNFHEGLAHVVR